MYDEFKLLKKVMDLDTWFINLMKYWPSFEHYENGLANSIKYSFKTIELKLIEHRGNSRKRSSSYRLNLLYEASTQLDYLKQLPPRLRKLKKGKKAQCKIYYITKKQHEFIVESLDEIGGLLGSYINTSLEKEDSKDTKS